MASVIVPLTSPNLRKHPCRECRTKDLTSFYLGFRHVRTNREMDRLSGPGTHRGLFRPHQRYVDQVLNQEPDLKFVSAQHSKCKDCVSRRSSSPGICALGYCIRPE